MRACYRAAILSTMLLLCSTQSTARSDRPSPLGPILFRDVVLIGRCAEVDTIERRLSLHCDAPGQSMRVFDWHLVECTPLVGCLEDDTMSVSTVRDATFGADHWVKGDSILFWGARLCLDGWRVVGRVAIVRAGRVYPSVNDRYLCTELAGPGHTSFPLECIIGAQASAPLEFGRGAVWDGSRAIGIATVRGLAWPDTEHTVAVELDSLGWALNTAARMPRRLLFRYGHDCDAGIEVGDTLVVPTLTERPGDDVELETCPQGLIVRDNVVVGLGVPLGSLGRALAQTGAHLELRQYVEK